jgi:hypothetical protein
MEHLYIKLLIAGYIVGQGGLILGICARYKIFGSGRGLLYGLFALHVICAAIIMFGA